MKKLISMVGLSLLLAACGAAPQTAPPETASGDMMSDDMMGASDSQAEPGYGGGVTIEGWQPTTDPNQIVDQLAQSDLFSAWLAAHPNWAGYAWAEEEEDATGWFSVEFIIEQGDDERFLAWAYLNAQTGEVEEWARIRQLTEAELAEGREAIAAIIASDPEIGALLGDPAAWAQEIGSDGGDDWYAYVYQGVQAYTMFFYKEDGRYQLVEIVDEAALEDGQMDDLLRDRAIELAFESEGIDEALAATDDWVALAENQQGSVWSVSFVSGEETLYFAVVDIDAETILETSQ